MTTELNGFCEAAFTPLREAFAANFDDGLEVGASVAACVRGRPVVDLWAGHADFAQTRPWAANTVVLLRSTTKIPLLICVLMLVDRGLIALDTPIATYWPEFAGGGKADVTVRDALTHQAGVPALDPPASYEEHVQWEVICARIAAEPHWFGGERRVAYHLVNSGFILGEVMRRVDGRTPRQFLREELAEPAGIDIQLGMETWERVAETGALSPPNPPAGDIDPTALRMTLSLSKGGWGSPVKGAEFPSSNAFGNGRSVARLATILADGGMLDGRRYLSEAIVREVFAEQVAGDCPMFGPMRLGLTVALDHLGFPMPSPTSAYWGGRGGSLCVMDPKTGLSFGYAMNNFIDALPGEIETRRVRFWEALSASLADLEASAPAPA